MSFAGDPFFCMLSRLLEVAYEVKVPNGFVNYTSRTSAGFQLDCSCRLVLPFLSLLAMGLTTYSPTVFKKDVSQCCFFFENCNIVGYSTIRII